ncbi:carboxypeptidase regulatory-like domain-containing protein [Fibrella forsythiae]|uniref:Carboxypeptidase-like regulatory domain-containing protein n=1 Tax=Fibrella forsythiae TaxID=2817061 RepID=A0ABS3JQT8_9BACT|nr:carboxypeptidase regulatory-like domain-containing protein [Fibrella forsythiae]MBO0952370.1 carboxypeptidase-like regulatory domain-containing protein [Fibrella forsythiae]
MNLKGLFMLVISQFVLAGLARAQAPIAIAGRVTDGVTQKPVPFASVYINASTRGTTADGEGQYKLPGVPSGTIEIVASAVGYETVKQLIRLGDVKNRRISFMLTPDAKALKAVTVKAKRPAAYNRMLKQFKRELLGENAAADKCVITNIEAVSLSMADGRLEASASEPLIIENNYSGYRLIYQLFHFDSYRAATYYGGTSRFEALTSANTEQAERWERNRQRVYLGSSRHLLTSLLAGTHEQDGFLVYESRYNVADDPSVPILGFGKEPPSKFVKADSLFTPAELPSERYFYSPKPLEVFYTRQRAASPYRDLPYAYSLVHMPKGAATVTVDGWVVHPNGMEMRGTLGSDRLATLLPADWQPASKNVKLQTATPDQGVALPADAVIDSLAANWLSAQKNTAPALFLHPDKGVYATGDRLFFSGYALDPATNLPTDKALAGEEPSVHVELIAPGGRQVVHQWVRISAGRTSGHFRLSDSLASGIYQLRAYTEGDSYNLRPAFARSVTIINGLLLGNDVPKPAGTPAGPLPVDVQFLPEGGRWVAGLPSRIGVKAVDRRGRGIPVSGRILLERSGKVLQFTTNSVGMCSVELVPIANQTYTAQVRWGADSSTIALPRADSVGLVLAADVVSDSTRLTIRVHASPQLADQPVYLTVQSKGQLVQRTKLQLQNGKATLSILAAKLPVGVAQVTLFDAKGHPQAERLVFIPERFLPVVAEIATDKPAYGPREMVMVSIRVADGFGDQLSMIGSAVVTDAQQVPDDSTEANIRTHLLLTGELRGSVEQPNEYLTNTDVGIRRALDDLLLTQGWRRINWRFSAEKLPEAPPLMPGLVVEGTLFDKKDRPLPEANLLITFAGNPENSFARTARSDKQGRFTLNSLMLTDTATIQIRAMDTAFKTIKNTRFTLNVPGHSFAVTDSAKAPDMATLKPVLAAIQQRQASDPGQYRNKDVRQLNEIVVRTKRPDDDREARRVSLHGTPDATVLFDENARIYNNAYEMLRGRVPGVQVTSRRDGIGYTVTVRGPSTLGTNTAPLYLIDGMAMPENGEGTALLTLNPTEIERIEVVKNGGGAIYGARGGAGIIAFFSQKGPSASKLLAEPETFQLTLYGLQTDRQFYTPLYASQPDSSVSVPDRRDVLLWKPLIMLSQSGFSTLKFPLSDNVRTIRLRLQGVTTYGRPVSISRLINVR